MQVMTRRQFVRNTTVLTTGLAFTGMTGLMPTRALAAKPQFLQTRCTGGDARSPKILVAYASMHGSTGEVADTIAKDLCRAGASVDVRLVGSIKDIGDYQGVIIGSAIKSDRWLPEATNFVSANKNVLSNLPTAYFLTCLTLVKRSKESQQLARSFLDPVFEIAPEVNPSGIGLFPGVLDYSKYSKGMGAVMHYKMWTKGIEAGDYRDWSMVHDFSRRFQSQLVQRDLLAEDV
jgi:menaquinone-dependent protoporphyrinogen oxidase